MAEPTPVVPQSKPGEATDPSALATQALWREVAHLKELIFIKLDSMDKAIDVAHADLVRVPTEVQKAVAALKELQAEEFRRVDQKFRDEDKLRKEEFSSIQTQFTAEARLRDEKFASIQTQFVERDVRTDTSRVSDKTAVDAALQAQKESAGKQAEAFQEATNKSEQQFTKQMDQQSELLKTEVRSIVTQINELKDRFNRGEGRSEGTEKAVVVHQAATADTKRGNEWLIGIVVGVLIAAIGIIVGILRG